ncbi:MAG: bactofilin family protein [Bacteriovoracaceae bacterium]|jgi:cytoskeletal protein CcmA (bactofilin family)
MAQGQNICAIIEEGCRFEGNLSFTGTVRIAGYVNGTIFSNDTLIVSEGAVINADINANIVVISGSVKGNIKATSRVEMRRPARFEGTVTSPSLIVEEGVIFHGITKMKDKK